MPDPDKRKAFVAQLAQTFIKSESRQMAGEGRAIQRRMNRSEYENALRDLLGVGRRRRRLAVVTGVIAAVILGLALPRS